MHLLQGRGALVVVANEKQGCVAIRAAPRPAGQH